MDKGEIMGGRISWTGGEMPVAGDAKVVVYLEHDSFGATAGNLYWEWQKGGTEGDILAYEVVDAGAADKPSPITSDGGSTGYYKLTIKNKAGETLCCELGDIIRAVVDNDFDLGNILKAARRMHLAAQGVGKEGTSVSYDANKIKYFADEYAFWNEVP